MSERKPEQIPCPGETEEMADQPRDEMREYEGRGLLAGKRALVTGGDSGIGRAVSIAFAKEGADVAIAYLSEDNDAAHTASLVGEEGVRALTIRGDLASAKHCRDVVDVTVRDLGGIDILVNNVAYQSPVDDFLELGEDQWARTFAVNIDSFFHVTKAAVAHMKHGSAIINTGSINGLRGNKTLIDYSATKGAVIALTYSLAQALLDKGIRVNCVAQDQCGRRSFRPLSSPRASGHLANKHRMAAPHSRTKLHRHMSFSLRTSCRRTTPVRCSHLSAARPYRDDGSAVARQSPITVRRRDVCSRRPATQRQGPKVV